MGSSGLPYISYISKGMRIIFYSSKGSTFNYLKFNKIKYPVNVKSNRESSPD